MSTSMNMNMHVPQCICGGQRTTLSVVAHLLWCCIHQATRPEGCRGICVSVCHLPCSSGVIDSCVVCVRFTWILGRVHLNSGAPSYTASASPSSLSSPLQHLNFTAIPNTSLNFISFFSNQVLTEAPTLVCGTDDTWSI